MPESNRRVLITGSAGFLGEATLDRLTANDESTFAVCVDTTQTNGPEGDTRRFVSVTRDITQPVVDLLADYEIDTVVHLAFVLQAQQDPDESHRVNVDATRSLLEACAKTGVKQFIYLSSATVYGAHAENDRPFSEDDPVHPVSGFTYSEHKVEAEQLVQEHGEANPDCAVSILRGCVVMGASANNFITESLGMRVLPVPAGTNPDMQFLHVDDYCSAVEVVIAQQARGVFNIAGSGTVSWREMVSIAGATAIPAPAAVLKGVTDLTWKLGLQHRSSSAGLAFIQYPWLVSTEKFTSELGWKPERTSEEAVRSWADSR